MMFESRESAANLLLEKLEQYKGKKPVVLGIPRGAMPMAKIIADGLGGELNAVLVHKIPFPGNEEFAIGCVGASGHVHAMPYAKTYGVSENYLQSAAKQQLEVLKKRQKKFGLEDPKIKDRTVIIVDDGIATGATTLCAIYEVRSQSPKKIVLACAVSSQSAAEKIRPLVDEFKVLAQPENFFGVSQFFVSFPQVTDEEVVEILNGAGKERYKPSEHRI